MLRTKCNRAAAWTVAVLLLAGSIALPAMSTEALAASQKGKAAQSKLPTLCPDLPANLRQWFEANASMFSEQIDPAHRPQTAEVCYRNGFIVVLATWELGQVAVQKDGDTWTSDFYLYFPGVKKILLFMTGPYDYLSTVVANYWQRSLDYPRQTLWVVELRNARGEGLRMVLVDQRGTLVSTGEIVAKVGDYGVQSFRAPISGRSPVLLTPRAPGGELTQQGLVYQFFDLLDVKP
jgi:hypothetical protein